MDRAVSEAAVQRTITDALNTFGYVWHHETDSRRSPSGLPDLNGWHPETLWSVHIEVKRELGRLSPAQMRFLAAMGASIYYILLPDITFVCVLEEWHRMVAVARPSNLDEVIAAIQQTATSD